MPLILGHKVVHIAFGFRELHLVHSLTSVPMQEGLASEHGREVLSHTLEHLLDRSAVASKSHGHLQTFWWDIADAAFDVVRNPLDEITGILFCTLGICSTTSLLLLRARKRHVARVTVLPETVANFTDWHWFQAELWLRNGDYNQSTSIRTAAVDTPHVNNVDG